MDLKKCRSRANIQTKKMKLDLKSRYDNTSEEGGP